MIPTDLAIMITIVAAAWVAWKLVELRADQLAAYGRRRRLEREAWEDDA